MNKLTIGLVSHLVRDFNLGCSALSISNIFIIDKVMEELGVEVKYIIIMPEPKNEVDRTKYKDLNEYMSISKYTKNEFEMQTYPRLKQILKNYRKFKTCKFFKECDYIINLCGGDGYTDIYGLIRLVSESIVAREAKKQKVKTIYAPQTIGPFNTFLGKKIAKKTLKQVDKIFVRDNQSLECCEKLLKRNDICEVIDVAFALPYNSQTLNSNKVKVGINISGLLFSGGYNGDNYFGLSFNYKEFCLSLVDKLIKNNYEVHLIPHVISEKVPVEDDYGACERVKALYPECIIPKKFENPIEAKSYISMMDFFAGARMHSTIAAFSTGVPVVPIAYSRKFTGLYHSLGYDYIIDGKKDLSLNDALELFFKYLENREEMKNKINDSKKLYLEKLNTYKEELKKIFGDK